jgi:hypothetical protein
MKLMFAFGAVALLSVAVTQAVAQTGLSPIVDTHEIADQTQSTAALRAEIWADIAQVRANAKASSITREQIQQLRLALRAKLSALRH